MSRPTTEIEDRLREALAARAEQVTPASLRPADPPKVKRRRRFIWVAPILAAAAAVLAILGVMSLVELGGQESTPPAGQPTIHTSGNCDHEAALMTRALLGPSESTVDIDGDGDGDQAATVTDPNAAPACRAFVGVRTNGELYSTALDPSAVPPPGRSARLTHGPDLGLDGRTDLVVNTHSTVDGALSQIFTWTGEGLVRVQAPGAEDGNLMVDGGGVTSEQAAGCTTNGSLVTSIADMVDQGKTYEVTRQTYPVTVDPLEFGDPRITTDQVPAAQLDQRFPEFVGGGFVPCST